MLVGAISFLVLVLLLLSLVTPVSGVRGQD